MNETPCIETKDSKMKFWLLLLAFTAVYLLFRVFDAFERRHVV